MGSLMHFISGVLAQGWGGQLWILVLITFNLVLPLYFGKKLETTICLLVFVLNSLLMIALTANFGYTRILGLGHFLWFPMLWYFGRRLKRYTWTDRYGFWIYGVVTVNSISLVLDVIDVVRYIVGDRGELM